MLMTDALGTLLQRFQSVQLLRKTRPARRRRLTHSVGPVEALERRALLNAAPVFGASSYSFSVAEDAAVGAAIGSVKATDADEDPLWYFIYAGDDNYEFYIDNGGMLRVGDTLDYETTSSYTLSIMVDDGLDSDYATINLTVTDVDEAPVFNPDTYTFSVAENASYGTLVGTLTATDPQNDPLLFAIASGDPNYDFWTDNDGKLYTVGGLDYDTTPSYSLSVQVSDGMDYDFASVTVNVTQA